MSKNKSKGKKPAGKVEESWDDEIDALLSAEASKNKPSEVASALAQPAASQKQAAEVPVSAAEADDDDDDEAIGEAGQSAKDKKKKKKKKKDEIAAPAASSSAAPPMSAAAKAIFQRKQQLAEEEARIKALQEAEERRIREIEEKEEAERQAVLAEKERKKKAKQDKVAAQKQAGTYMTKSEKEKARKIQERLEQMKAAGIELPTGSESAQPIYSRRKKVQTQTKEDSDSSDDESPESPTKEASIEVVVADSTAAETAASLPVAQEKDWEDDDWEASIDNISVQAQVQLNIAPSATSPQKAAVGDDEDLLEVEKRAEKERFKQLGLERLRREEEARIKREQEEQERAEMDRQAKEAAQRKETSKRKRLLRESEAKAARSPDNLRAAISVIMGHVDTGKTKLLDKIRNTNVQEGEAGGITQQIGATHFPRETLALQTNAMQAKNPFEIKLPGLLVIDTPGHESFSNLRNRGSSLCDVAILVIDLMHGLEPQTIESINLLRKKNAPFIVALNKVDRLYGWKRLPDGPIRDALALQDDNCIAEFKDRSDNIILQLNKLGLNAKMYWENDSLEDTISLVPTSAHSGEGVPDLLMNLISYAQNQLNEKLMYYNYLQCTVLEVKVIEGLGPSIDVVLLNGVIKEGDRIVVSTMEGPLVTTIRALLTPPPNREMRIKSEYIHHQAVQGAIGVKIVAPELSRTVAGTQLMVIHEDDDEEELMEDVQSDLSSITKLSTDSKGVTVHASTLGALEALLQFLQKECKPTIPVSAVSIGTIFKRDVMRAAIMNDKGLPEYATILAFDVKIDSEAQSYADEANVRIFTADIIYHLFDQFTRFMTTLMETRKAEAAGRAVFPCVLKIFPQHVFNKKDPIVVGVEVLEGTLKVQTPLYIPQLALDVGRVVSIENNHKEATQAKKGTSVSIKISCESNPNLMYGRQFDHNHALYSKISRDSIDALKDFFKDEVSKEDWQLIIKLKKVFNINDQPKKKAAPVKKPDRDDDIMPPVTDFDEYDD